MSIKCPDSGMQVGCVLPKGNNILIGLASDANFICAVATIFDTPFFVENTHTHLNIHTDYLLKSSVSVVNQMWDFTNSNDMPRSRSQWLFLEKKNIIAPESSFMNQF